MKKIFLLLSICAMANAQSNRDDFLIPVPALEYWEQGVSQAVYGYINTEGEMVISPQYSSAGYFRNGLAVVSYEFFTVVSHEPDPFYEPESHLIDTQGKIVKTFKQISLPYEFTEEQPGNIRVNIHTPERLDFHDGLAPVSRPAGGNLETLYIGKAGKIQFRIDQKLGGREFSEQRAVIYEKETHLCGFIDTAGNIVIPPQFKEAASFKNRAAVVRKTDNKYIFIDRDGGRLFEQEFDIAYSFSENLAPAAVWQENTNIGNFGFIDKKGEWVLQPAYKLAEPFAGGFSLVADDDAQTGYTYYFIDRNGENIFHRFFMSAGSFYQGYAFVTYQDPETEEYSIIKAVIDTKGTDIWNSKNYIPENINPLFQ